MISLTMTDKNKGVIRTEHKKMKILVTGAAGFIGSKIAYLLARRGDEVVGIDNLNDYYDLRLKWGHLRLRIP